jgi:hypothetical protein
VNSRRSRGIWRHKIDITLDLSAEPSSWEIELFLDAARRALAGDEIAGNDNAKEGNPEHP